ncbi:MAG: NAD-dependent epimerase [Nitrospirales bacterium]|nr:MAG: NAD-dependent epimerase [Nitrospirales bacterium]
MKILVVGNMGYVGPSVIRRFRRSYPDGIIIGFDMGYFGHCLTTCDMLPECRADMQCIGDLRKFPAHLLENVQAVIQLAAISNDPMGKQYEDVTYDVNHRSSVQLAKMAKEAGVKAFVFPSSCSIYGSSDGTAKTEDSTVDPLTAYAKSKIMAERELALLADDSFMVTCLRFATACGMSDRLRLDLVLNDFVANAFVSRKIDVLSDGSPWRPLIHVKDMARAIDWAATRTSANGGPFLTVNVGSDEWNYQVKDLAEAVVNELSEIKLSINPDAQLDKRSYRVSFQRYKELAPLHQPLMSLKDVIGELQGALMAMEFHDANFRDSNLIRHTVLRGLQKKKLLNELLEWCAES